LASRIDRLPLDEKRLLQSAAVIGKDVPFGFLQGIAGLPEEELRRGLAHLQAAEFLYETTLFPDLEYTFKHALTHDVAYGSLEQAIDLRFELRNSLFPLGELEAMLTNLREAERLAKSLDDPRRLAWVSVYMSQYSWVTGHLTDARTFGEHAGAIAETLGDSPL